MKQLTKASLALLGAIIAATDANGNGHVAESSKPALELLAAALIEVNTDDSLRNGEGEAAARPTDAGRHYAATGALPGETATKTVAPSKASFVIEKNIPLAPKTRAAVAEKYPFEVLEIGDSFFVANSEVGSGNAYKTLASTVATANGKYAEEVPGEFRPNKKDNSKQVPVTRQLRKFELRQDQREVEGQVVSGARVHRVAV